MEENIRIDSSVVSVEQRVIRCENTVLKHYCRIMKILAFQNLLKPDTRGKIAVNILYSLIVFGGFVGLFVANFKLKNQSGEGFCSMFPHWNAIVSVVPGAGLLLVFIMIRLQPKDKVEALAQWVFSSLGGPEGTYLCQKMFFRWVKVIISTGAVLFVTDFACDFSRQVLNEKIPEIRYTLLVYYLLAAAFISAVLLHYMMQCLLLVFFAEGLKRRILCKDVTLYTARLECLKIKEYASSLKTYCSFPVILTTFFNVSDLIYYAMSADGYEYQTILMLLTEVLLVLLPVLGNAKLSSSIDALRSTGAEVSCLIEGYIDESREDIQTLMMFLSTLQIPVPTLLLPSTVLFAVAALVTCTYYTLVNHNLVVYINNTMHV